MIYIIKKEKLFNNFMELFEENVMNDKNDFSINYINEIKKKVNIMKENTYRTTNFSIIVYFVKNNFLPLNKSILISNLIRDYKNSPNIFISKKTNSIFKSESSFRRSIGYYINNNNSFYEGPGKEQLSLNLENAVFYLRSVFNKYKNNSRDVKTPIKYYDNKKNRNKKDALKMKKELTGFDSFDEDEKRPLFLQNIKNINYNNKYNYLEYFNKIKQEQTDEDSKETKSIISLSDESVAKSKEISINENMKNIPKIFISKLIDDSLISSIDKKDIFSIMDLTSEYMTNIEYFNNNQKIKDKFNKLYISLQNLLDNKQSHEKALNALNTFQAQILNAWKLMKTQLYSVNLSINTKNYKYDLYVSLKDIIFQTEGIYKENLEKIKNNLNKLYDLEKKSKEEAKIIQRTLISIKNDIEHSDNDFNKIYKLIKDKLNIKEKFEFNNIMDEEDEFDFFLVDKVGQIVNKFHAEKKQIMEEFKRIDKNIGNIMIY